MKKLTIIASLVALFILGAICGLALAVPFARKLLSEDRLVQQRMAEEKKRLKLTAEQVEKAKPVYDALKSDLAKVKADALAGVTQAALRQAGDLAAILTPQQIEEYKKLGEERRARFEKLIKP